VRIAIEQIQLLAVAPPAWPGSGPEVYACIRGEEVMLQRDRGGGSGGDGGETLSARNRFAAIVEELVAEGPLVRVRLQASPETPSPARAASACAGLTGPVRLQALVTRPACGALGLQPGQRVEVLIKAAAIHLMPRRAAAETARPADPGHASSLPRAAGDGVNRSR